MSVVEPTLAEWLVLPRAEIAAHVSQHHLAVLFSVDGTRRHYLIHRGKDEIADFTEYAEHGAESYVRAYDVLFGLGVETVMTPLLYPPNFVRGGNYLAQSLKMCRHLLVNAPFTDLYARWGLKARLYGDYDFAPNAASSRAEITDLANVLTQATPHGERTLLFGYAAGSFTEEIVVRSLALYQATGRIPSQAELVAACFPDGPTQVHFWLGAGWLRVGITLPTQLDNGRTDIYGLAHLALDLQETTLRRILYDHLFRRWAGPEDDVAYTPTDLRELGDYYRLHADCVTGLGSLVGPGLWYPDHAHE
jgi:adenosine tuberculosinyltransferase